MRTKDSFAFQWLKTTICPYHWVYLRMPEASSPKYEMHSEAGLFATAALQTWRRKMATACERDSWRYEAAPWGGKENFHLHLVLRVQVVSCVWLCTVCGCFCVCTYVPECTLLCIPSGCQTMFDNLYLYFHFSFSDICQRSMSVMRDRSKVSKHEHSQTSEAFYKHEKYEKTKSNQNESWKLN